MPNKLKMRIESRERRKGIISREIILGTNDLSKCSEDKLKTYLKYLQNPENSVAGKIPDDTPVVKDSISDLSDDISQLLKYVAERYKVTPEAIYEYYLSLKRRLGNYPLSDFKEVLQNAGRDSEVFEGGFIRNIKLSYTDSIVYGKLRLYKLTSENNSRDDIIRECYKIELVLCDLGVLEESLILSNRIKYVGLALLDRVKSKSTLLEYFEERYYLLGERLAIIG